MVKQKRGWSAVVVGVALGTLWLARGLAQASTLELSELRFAGADAQKTLTLRFSQPPTAVHSFVLTSPTRLVIDVSGPVGTASPGTIVVQDALLARIRTGTHDQRLLPGLADKTPFFFPFADHVDRELGSWIFFSDQFGKLFINAISGGGAPLVFICRVTTVHDTKVGCAGADTMTQLVLFQMPTLVLR